VVVAAGVDRIAFCVTGIEPHEMGFVAADADPGIAAIHVIPVVSVALKLVLISARGLVRGLSPLATDAFDHDCWLGMNVTSALTVMGSARTVKEARSRERRQSHRETIDRTAL
jgi:hypothetical protein